ncbi:MAG: protein translocase subunit SecF [Piscirickettsiaceae bacterium]|nr:protein translocase subunit SecF [Piscirickettsiaceae bacterium]
MQFIKGKTNFRFMKKRRLAALFSLLLILISIASLGIVGLNFGIDFTGGTIIEVAYDGEMDLDSMREALKQGGFNSALVQYFGSIHEILIRIPVIEEHNRAELSDRVVVILQANNEVPFDIRRIEFVGPQVGKELTEQGSLAMLYAIISILIYVSLRFEYRFAIGSVIALIHDVIITLGFLSIMQLEFNLTVLAAILAVLGYSLNDTIVVFDRVRETFLNMRKGSSEWIVNCALNDTLSRTMMTSMTTLLVVLALFIFGGKAIHVFSIVLISGIILGTYSSIYIASGILLGMGINKINSITVEKNNSDDLV